jgi:Lon protease-like protein
LARIAWWPSACSWKGEELEEGNIPRVANVASVGELVLAQELPDGRFNLVVRGRARIGIDEELPAKSPTA